MVDIQGRLLCVIIYRVITIVKFIFIFHYLSTDFMADICSCGGDLYML